LPGEVFGLDRAKPGLRRELVERYPRALRRHRDDTILYAFPGTVTNGV